MSHVSAERWCIGIALDLATQSQEAAVPITANQRAITLNTSRLAEAKRKRRRQKFPPKRLT